MAEISDYYIIGDLHSAALVSKNASIDWLCLPHFDSSSIFGKLLDENGGNFSIDAEEFDIVSTYIKNTAIVQHDFKKVDAEFSLKDYMVVEPLYKCDHHYLMRKFEGKKGTTLIRLIFNPRPNYAKGEFDVTFNKKKNALKTLIGKDTLLLYLPKGVTFEERDSHYEITFMLSSGETKLITLEYTACHTKPAFIGKDKELDTTHFWRKWVKKGKYPKFYRDKTIRSAITLKLMQFFPTGAIVAAPTTSLPEKIGGERNWDYRFVWIRDATFTLYAFYVLGYKQEAKKFFAFIEKILEKCEEDKTSIALMYTIDGEKVPEEKILDNLVGFKNSSPVRVGNGATHQFQLDTYGSLIDANYFISKRWVRLKKSDKMILRHALERIERLWQEKDNSIWEIRDDKKDYIYSKVMAWVGVDRYLRMKDKLGLSEEDVLKYTNLEQEIKEWIWKNGYDEKKQIFLQYPTGRFQDATVFLFVLLQFLHKDDPLTRKVIENTYKDLGRGAFVYRYRRKDGLQGTEGAFLLCTFWLISALAIIGEVKKAFSLFCELDKYIEKNDLLPEELDPKSGEYLGNYPQAFSHVGYIMTIYYIERYSKKLHIPLG